MKRNHLALVGALALAAALCQNLKADNFLPTMEPVGHGTNGLMTPVNQLVTPAGIPLDLPGMRPQALALSPNGKILVTAGARAHELVVVDPANGTIVQQVEMPADAAQEQTTASSPGVNRNEKAQLSFTGLVFSPDGSRIYLSNVGGDIKVFTVADGKVAGLGTWPLPDAKAPDRDKEIPAGLAVSADGKRLYVAGNLSNQLFELDAATGRVLRTWNTGFAPFDVVLCRGKAYVSNWGGRRPDAASTTAPAGQGTLVRADARSIASEGSLTVIDLGKPVATGVTKEIVLGTHTCALALSPNGKYLVAASAGTDMLNVLNTHSDEIVETVTTRQQPGDPFGAQPDALAFDAAGKILYCANGSQNAVAVFQFKPGATQLLGLIPTGWFPGALAFDARRKMIDVANIKNIGQKIQKPRAGLGNGMGFNTQQYDGSLSLIPLPDSTRLAADTQKVLDDLRYPLLTEAKLPPRPNHGPVPVPERAGEPSVFHHVIYIIKENRTYDQVLGDVGEGNGAPELCAFGEKVTPNLHKLVKEFTLLDNTYCCSILSADGHNWADSGLATEYLEREFAGFPRSYPAGGFGDDGRDALAYSPAGFIWNDALAHGKSVVDFGEYSTSTAHWKDAKRQDKPHFADYYHDFVTGGDSLVISSEPDIESLRPFLVTNTVGWDLDIPDVVRAAKFIQQLKNFEAAGNMPNLVVIWLPNDHTSGTKPGSPQPQAQAADNDRAMGQVIEAVSHSKFWADTCIFAVEDDPQNGWDHVSGYRTTAYVASPYTKRGAVVSTQYNQTSILRTMELMLGLPPMNQFDATATPMFDCFTNQADLTAFDAVTNNVPLDLMNPPAKKQADPQARQDAATSDRLPLAQADKCPEDALNRIIWRATMGSKPYPAWAVKAVPDED